MLEPIFLASNSVVQRRFFWVQPRQNKNMQGYVKQSLTREVSLAVVSRRNLPSSVRLTLNIHSGCSLSWWIRISSATHIRLIESESPSNCQNTYIAGCLHDDNISLRLGHPSSRLPHTQWEKDLRDSASKTSGDELYKSTWMYLIKEAYGIRRPGNT